MDLLKNNLVVGVGLAFAATVLAPIVVPVMGRVGRPLAKSLVRGGMLMYEKGREAVAVAGESVEDMMAEIRAESAVANGSGQQAPAARATPQADLDQPGAGTGNGASPMSPAAPGSEQAGTATT